MRLRVLETAQHVGILDPQVLRWSLKALLCGRGDEWRRFDALFDAYFLPPNQSIFTEGSVADAGGLHTAGVPEPTRVRGGAESESAPDAGSDVAGDRMPAPPGTARAARNRWRRPISAS